VKRLATVVALLGILVWTSVASAATISMSVTTDKDTYLPGEMVHWTIYAWASSGDNAGVALLSADLADSLGEVFNAALTSGGGPTFELQGTGYGVDEWFILQSAGNPGVAGQLQDILVNQSPSFPKYNIGNVGSESLALVYAQGEFEATMMGVHTLSASVRAANYWPTGGGSAQDFGTKIGGNTQFEVVPEPATLVLLSLGGVALLRRRR